MLNGWSIAVETTGGIVGLETRWDGESLKLCYPDGVNVPDEIITETLGISLAKPVPNTQTGTRLWAKYYSEKLDCGRVWIDQCDYNPGYLEIIKDENSCRSYWNATCISTFDLECCTTKNPESPTCKAKHIQPYTNKFIALLVKIAKMVGDIKAINLYSNEVSMFTPDIMKEAGYVLTPKEDLSDEDLTCYYTTDGASGIEIMLECYSETWWTLIRCPANSNVLTAEVLTELISKIDNSSGLCDINTIAYFRDIAIASTL